MAEGFEQQYHVPQQTRRDKLRVVNNLHDCPPFFPLCNNNPSLVVSSDLNNLNHQSFNLCPNTNMGLKEEGINLMGFLGGINMNNNASSSSNHHLYHEDPQFINHPSPFLYNYTNSPTTGTGAAGQSLSLSLSSSHNNTNNNNNNLPLELNLQRFDYESSMFSDNNNKIISHEVSRSSVPLGPFTGYASVLNGSRFLKPAHQLLEELCAVGREIYAESSLLNSPSSESLNIEDGVVEESSMSNNCIDVGEQTNRKSRLLSMLDEVYKRYKLYYQQVQAIVASFESVAGLSTAAPFANLALRALSKHFRCLKNAITNQLQFISKSHGKINCEGDETRILKISGHGPFIQKPFHRTGFVEQPVWRPQRGLPERAVTVLRAWLFEHFLHPYPTDTDKLMLAKQAGLSRNQVSNWFINARVRLWKPMVEEIHMLETRQSQKDIQREEQPANRLNDHLPTSSSVECGNASTSDPKFTLKRTREDLTETCRGNDNPMNLQYDNHMSHHPQSGVGVVNAGGVSLTLGLHQNEMGLSESYPIHAARRLGLDSQGEGYMLSGFAPATQNRQFGRDIIG